MVCAFCMQFKKSFPTSMSWRLFSSASFIVWGFPFQTIIHLRQIYRYKVVLALFVTKTLFFQLNEIGPFMTNWMIKYVWVHFCTLYLVPLICSRYICQFQMNLIVLPIKNCSPYSKFLVFHKNLRISLSIPTKKSARMLLISID